MFGLGSFLEELRARMKLIFFLKNLHVKSLLFWSDYLRKKNMKIGIGIFFFLSQEGRQKNQM